MAIAVISKACDETVRLLDWSESVVALIALRQRPVNSLAVPAPADGPTAG